MVASWCYQARTALPYDPGKNLRQGCHPVQVLLRGFGIEADGLTKMHLDVAKQLKRLQALLNACLLHYFLMFRKEPRIMSDLHATQAH